MAKHALLSASGAHRWLECTPSAQLELQFPQSTSEYAEEGTAAHELCELTARYWLGEISEAEYENQRDELAKGKYYNAEMQECANDYAKFVAEKTAAARETCEDAFTLTQMEKDFGKKAVAETLGELIVKPQGKPTLAPAKDKRPEFRPEEQLLAEFDK